MDRTETLTGGVAAPVPKTLSAAFAVALIVCLLLGLVAGSAVTARRLSRQLPVAEAQVSAAAGPDDREPGPARRRLVEVGDTLYGIAIEEGVPMGSLCDANPQITDPDIIFAGTYIQVPAGR